jgi:hypothetical protein
MVLLLRVRAYAVMSDARAYASQSNEDSLISSTIHNQQLNFSSTLQSISTSSSSSHSLMQL